jgi:predicted N-acetyltransferase YhbS
MVWQRMVAVGSSQRATRLPDRKPRRPRIRVLNESDVAAATALANVEGWNQTSQDWRLILRHSAGGSFMASLGGRMIGTVSTVKYAAALGWIGMLVVVEKHRGQGVGRSLMQAAMNYLQESGVQGVKLDATPAGQPLYRSLGFQPRAIVCRWQGVPSAAPQRRSRAPMTKELRAAVRALDRRAFGVGRQAVLDQLLANCSVVPVVATSSSPAGACGYGLGRRGAKAFYIGPVVADSDSNATWILEKLLAQLSGEKVCFDQLVHWSSAASLLGKRGFVKQRALMRMSYGRPSDAGVGRSIFCSAGPELG